MSSFLQDRKEESEKENECLGELEKRGREEREEVGECVGWWGRGRALRWLSINR